MGWFLRSGQSPLISISKDAFAERLVFARRGGPPLSSRVRQRLVVALTTPYAPKGPSLFAQLIRYQQRRHLRRASLRGLCLDANASSYRETAPSGRIGHNSFPVC